MNNTQFSSVLNDSLGNLDVHLYFSAPFSLRSYCGAIWKFFFSFSSQQNNHTFDNNHSENERTALRLSNWLYHIFTIYSQEMHIYIYIYTEKKTLPMAYRHIHSPHLTWEKMLFCAHYAHKQKSEKSIMLTECAYCTVHSSFLYVHMHIIIWKHGYSLHRHACV